MKKRLRSPHRSDGQKKKKQKKHRALPPISRRLTSKYARDWIPLEPPSACLVSPTNSIDPVPYIATSRYRHCRGRAADTLRRRVSFFLSCRGTCPHDVWLAATAMGQRAGRACDAHRTPRHGLGAGRFRTAHQSPALSPLTKKRARLMPVDDGSHGNRSTKSASWIRKIFFFFSFFLPTTSAARHMHAVNSVASEEFVGAGSRSLDVPHRRP